MNESDLKSALAFATTVIAAEHMFSAGMSSPWSTAKFTESPDDKRIVWKLFGMSVAASLAFAVIVGFLMKDNKALVWGIVGVGAISVLMAYEYQNALGGTL